jgi:hypothetical protein
MKGQTPVETQALMRAVDEGDVARVRVLLAAGADPNAAAEYGETALMRAVAKGDLEVVEVLLDAGGDVHAKSENGFTPLFMAVFFGHVAIARALLARGSDPSAPTRANTTAEEWARSWGSAEIVELLENVDAIRAQASASAGGTADAVQADAPPTFFPADGEIRPVVPLSEIGGAQAVRETTPLTEAGADEPEPLESARAEVGQTARVGQYDAPDETTLVHARTSRATLPPVAPAARPKGAGPSWVAPLVALALSLVAGLFAGTYLIESRLSVATEQSAPQTPEPAPPAEPVSATARPAPAVTDGEAEAEREKVKAEVPAPQPTPSETASLRAHVAEPPPPRVVITESRPERPAHAAARSVDRPAAERPVRRDVAATAARVAERPPSAPAPPKNSLLVSSPPPSAKSKKVIQWP